MAAPPSSAKTGCVSAGRRPGRGDKAEPIIQLNGVTNRYGALAAVDGLTLAIEPGSFTALLGGSGSGKTTALKTINGLVTPDAGEVRVHGRLVAGEPGWALRRRIGYVFQEIGLFPHADPLAREHRRPLGRGSPGWDKPRHRGAHPRRATEAGRAPRRRRRAAAGGAFRRPATADRRRPCAGGQAGDHADGRAVRCARSRHPRRARPRLPRAARANWASPAMVGRLPAASGRRCCWPTASWCWPTDQMAGNEPQGAASSPATADDRACRPGGRRSAEQAELERAAMSAGTRG